MPDGSTLSVARIRRVLVRALFKPSSSLDQCCLVCLNLVLGHPPIGGKRLPDDLIHVVIAVGGKPPDKGDVRPGRSQRLIALVEGVIVGPRDRIIGVAVGPRDSATDLVVSRRHTRELRDMLANR